MSAAFLAVWAERSGFEDYAWLVWLAIVGGAILIGLHLQKKRRQEVEQAAAAMGFQFDAEAEGVKMETELLALPLLKQNSGLSNALRGTTGPGETHVVDVRIGSGKHAYTQSVACFRLAGKQLPTFEMRPEHFGHSIAKAFGYQDINFDGSPGFSKSYLLRGPDEPAVRLLFHPGVLQFFETEKSWAVEGAGDWLIAYRQAKTVKGKDLATFLQESARVAELFAGRF